MQREDFGMTRKLVEENGMDAVGFDVDMESDAEALSGA
jgi:hypothetical protein